ITALFIPPTISPSAPQEPAAEIGNSEVVLPTPTPTLTTMPQVEKIDPITPTPQATKTFTPIPPTPTVTITPTPSLIVKTITLPAAQSHYETGVFITAGQSVTIRHVQGNWRTGPQAMWP